MFGFTSFSELPFSDVSAGQAVEIEAGTGSLTLTGQVVSIAAGMTASPAK